MCDFVSENIALNKFTWQLNPYENEEIADYLNSSKAVDGLKTNLSFSGYQCTISASMKYMAIWRLYLRDILGIHHITIHYRTDNMEWGEYNCCFTYLSIYLFFIMLISCFTCIEFLQIGGPNNENVGKLLGFSVYVSNLTLLEDRVLCFHDFHFDKYTILAVITLNCTMHGRYIEFQNNRTRSSFPADYSRYASNDLCEFEVYGE